MTIKFICSCGKHLRARDEMASRRSVCPRCGAPVGVPSLRPTHPASTLGPMTPDERRRARKNAPPSGIALTPGSLPGAGASAAAPQPLDLEQLRLGPPESVPRPPRTVSRGWELETCWHQCLWHPVRVLPLLLALAVGMLFLSGGAASLLPNLLNTPPGQRWVMVVYCLPFLLLPASVCTFLHRVFTSAAAGESFFVYWPVGNLVSLLKYGGTWLVCFLAGPACLVVGAVFYWLHCGDAEWLDQLILAEMGVLGIAWWLLLIVAVGQRGRLWAANPVSVVRLVCRVGDRLVLVALAAGLFGLVHGWLLFIGLTEWHHNAALGGLLLLVCWTSVLAGATFLFRLLGLWCHRAARP